MSCDELMKKITAHISGDTEVIEVTEKVKKTGDIEINTIPA